VSGIEVIGPMVTVPKRHRPRRRDTVCNEQCAALHPSFDYKAPHFDRAYPSFEAAVDSADRRVRLGHNSRQRISRHYGPIFKRGIWFVQDVR
jgi:hypothetical protein